MTDVACHAPVVEQSVLDAFWDAPSLDALPSVLQHQTFIRVDDSKRVYRVRVASEDMFTIFVMLRLDQHDHAVFMVREWFAAMNSIGQCLRWCRLGPYVVIHNRYAPGLTLSERYEQGFRLRATRTEMAKLQQQIEAAHARGFVHRDITIGNIMADPGLTIIDWDTAVFLAGACTHSEIIHASCIPGEQPRGYVSTRDDYHMAANALAYMAPGHAYYADDVAPLHFARNHTADSPLWDWLYTPKVGYGRPETKWWGSVPHHLDSAASVPDDELEVLFDLCEEHEVESVVRSHAVLLLRQTLAAGQFHDGLPHACLYVSNILLQAHKDPLFPMEDMDLVEHVLHRAHALPPAALLMRWFLDMVEPTDVDTDMWRASTERLVARCDEVVASGDAVDTYQLGVSALHALYGHVDGFREAAACRFTALPDEAWVTRFTQYLRS